MDLSRSATRWPDGRRRSKYGLTTPIDALVTYRKLSRPKTAMVTNTTVRGRNQFFFSFGLFDRLRTKSSTSSLRTATRTPEAIDMSEFNKTVDMIQFPRNKPLCRAGRFARVNTGEDAPSDMWRRAGMHLGEYLAHAKEVARAGGSARRSEPSGRTE